jgi:hypothetical protein
MGRHGDDSRPDDEDEPQDTDDEVHRGVSGSGQGDHRDDGEDDD